MALNKRKTRMYEPWGYQDENNYESDENIIIDNLEKLFADASYNNDDKKIHFFNTDGDERATIDVTEFSNSVIESVTYDNVTKILTIVFSNGDVIDINIGDLIDETDFGDGLEVISGVVSVRIDENGEPYLSVSEDGVKISGISEAITSAVTSEIERVISGITDLEYKLGYKDNNTLNKNRDFEVAFGTYNVSNSGTTPSANTVASVGIGTSNTDRSNGLEVRENGDVYMWIEGEYMQVNDLIAMLAHEVYDTDTVIVNTSADITSITTPQTTDLLIASSPALNSMTANNKVYKTIGTANVTSTTQVYLRASEYLIIDTMTVRGNTSSGRINFSSPSVKISNVIVENGSAIHKVFNGDDTNTNLKELNVKNLVVDNPSLTNHVINVYKPKPNCVINIKDCEFNLTVDNSNVLRLANLANVTGVTVNFENVKWTYENGSTFHNWGLAGLVVYQPYGSDNGIDGDLSAMNTWTFNFKNCEYNGVKVTSNNFGAHNQVIYMYNVGSTGAIANPTTFTINFE